MNMVTIRTGMMVAVFLHVLLVGFLQLLVQSGVRVMFATSLF